MQPVWRTAPAQWSLTYCIRAALQVANAAQQDAADGEDFESGILKKRVKPSVNVDSLPVNQKQLQQVSCLPAALWQADLDRNGPLN